MRRNVTWGTEVKIICVAQMSCVDVVVYTHMAIGLDTGQMCLTLQAKLFT